MFPSQGHFTKTACPFFKTGHCERPHCHFAHFKHSASKLASEKTSTPLQNDHKDKKVKATVPEYIPTPKVPSKETNPGGEKATKETKSTKLTTNSSTSSNGLKTKSDTKEYKLTESDWNLAPSLS